MSQIYTITKKIAKHGPQSIIVIPSLLKHILKPKTIVEQIDILIEASPVSDYEMFLTTQKRIQHRANISYQSMEHKLKQIFKRIDPENFIDRKEVFIKIK